MKKNEFYEKLIWLIALERENYKKIKSRFY